MNSELPMVAVNDCWNRIGTRGDGSCPELERYIHCQNCPVFASAGRRFLEAPSPPGYLDEWTARLAAPAEEDAEHVESVLTFRIGDEWLALRVQVLDEVALPRPIHRVPHRGGLLAGLVNIRGELELCVHLAELLGIAAPWPTHSPSARTPRSTATMARPSTPGSAESERSDRLLVVRETGRRWVFPVHEIDRVNRISRDSLQPPPATIRRATGHLTSGVFTSDRRAVGLLDEWKLWEALRVRLR